MNVEFCTKARSTILRGDLRYLRLSRRAGGAAGESLDDPKRPYTATYATNYGSI